MSEFKYDPLTNNFTIYKASEIEPIEVQLPLNDGPALDVSSWSTGISESGVPIAKSTFIANIDNSPIVETQQNTNSGNVSSVKGTGNQKKALEFFVNKGLTINQAAGVVGNLMHESGDKTLTKITNIGDKGTSFGMAQWHDTSPGKGRWTNLKKFAKDRGTSENDFNTQLEFVWHELESNPRWLNHLKSTSTIEDATSSFMNNFERPNLKYATLASRISNAKSII